MPPPALPPHFSPFLRPPPPQGFKNSKNQLTSHKPEATQLPALPALIETSPLKLTKEPHMPVRFLLEKEAGSVCVGNGSGFVVVGMMSLC